MDKVSGLRSIRREFRPLGNLCFFLTDLSFKIFLTQTANFSHVWLSTVYHHYIFHIQNIFTLNLNDFLTKLKTQNRLRNRCVNLVSYPKKTHILTPTECYQLDLYFANIWRGNDAALAYTRYFTMNNTEQHFYTAFLFKNDIWFAKIYAQLAEQYFIATLQLKSQQISKVYTSTIRIMCNWLITIS